MYGHEQLRTSGVFTSFAWSYTKPTFRNAISYVDMAVVLHIKSLFFLLFLHAKACTNCISLQYRADLRTKQM